MGAAPSIMAPPGLGMLGPPGLGGGMLPDVGPLDDMLMMGMSMAPPPGLVVGMGMNLGMMMMMGAHGGRRGAKGPDTTGIREVDQMFAHPAPAVVSLSVPSKDGNDGSIAPFPVEGESGAEAEDHVSPICFLEPPYPWIHGAEKQVADNPKKKTQFFKDTSSGAVFLLMGGCLRLVNPAHLGLMIVKPPDFNMLPVEDIPFGPPMTNSKLIKAEGKPEMYITDEWNNTTIKRLIKGTPELDAFRFNKNRIEKRPAWEVEVMMDGQPISFAECPWTAGIDPRGEKNNQVFKRESDGTVFLLVGGLLREVPEVVQKKLFIEGDIWAVKTAEEFGYVPQSWIGPPLPESCRLIKVEGKQEVYMQDEWDGKKVKRLVKTELEMGTHRFDPEKVESLFKKEVDALMSGKTIDHCPIPWLTGADPKGLQNSQLYKRESDGMIMLLIGGYIRQVPDDDTFKKLFKDDAVFNMTSDLEWGGLAVGPPLPTSAKLVQVEKDDPNIYMTDVWNGKVVRRLLWSDDETATHQFDIGKVVKIKKRELDAMPEGKPINHIPAPWLAGQDQLGANNGMQLYANESKNEMYVLLGSLLRRIPNDEIYRRVFGGQVPIAQMNKLDEHFNGLPKGPPLGKLCRLMKEKGKDAIFFDDDWNGRKIKRHIKNPNSLMLYRMDKGATFEVTKADIEERIDGQAIGW